MFDGRNILDHQKLYDIGFEEANAKGTTLKAPRIENIARLNSHQKI